MDSLETIQVHMDSFETHFGRNLDTPWGGVHGFLRNPLWAEFGYTLGDEHGFLRNPVWAEFEHTLGGACMDSFKTKQVPMDSLETLFGRNLVAPLEGPIAFWGPAMIVR